MRLIRALTVALTVALGVLPAQATPSAYWLPPVVAPWQWEISGDALNLSYAQSGRTLIYDIDYLFYSATEVSQLHALGQHVWCYMDVGAWESYRPDAGQFPSVVIGKSTGWNGERYLDIRPAALAQYHAIMEARFDTCAAKGFDGVEGDYQNNLYDCPTDQNGCFPTNLTNQEAFNQWFIGAVHARGLSAGLKNAPENAARWAAWPDATHPNGYDWWLVEQAFQYREINPGATAFVSSGRPVFAAEYKGQLSNFCPRANALNVNANKFPKNLNGSNTQFCR